MKYPFMGVIADCLASTHHEPDVVQNVRDAFLRIADEHPDLAERYDLAFPRRDAGEIERLLLICHDILEANEGFSLSNLRINAVTKRFFVGTGRSVPLFPYLQGI